MSRSPILLLVLMEAFQSEAPLLTTLADMLPFYNTKAKSSITVSAEAARLFPVIQEPLPKKELPI